MIISSPFSISLQTKLIEPQLKVHFRDGTTLIYFKEDLTPLSFFNNYQNQPIDKRHFLIVKGLIIDQKLLYEVLNDEEWTPHFLDQLNEIINYFEPLNNFSLALEAYGMPLKALPKLRQLKKPYSKAAFSIFKMNLIVKNENEVETHFRNTLKELKIVKKLSKNSSVDYCRNAWRSYEDLLNCQLKEIEKYLPKMSLQNCVDRYLHSDDYHEITTARFCQLVLKEYTTTILKAQERSRANMERWDLLEYIVGPKCYLLDYYKFVCNENSGQCPYKNLQVPNVQFYFPLNDLSPRNLELSMRNDIITANPEAKLPPMLISEERITAIISDEIRSFRDEILNSYTHYSQLSERQKFELLRKLLKFLGVERTTLIGLIRFLKIENDEKIIFCLGETPLELHLRLFDLEASLYQKKDETKILITPEQTKEFLEIMKI